MIIQQKIKINKLSMNRQILKDDENKIIDDGFSSEQDVQHQEIMVEQVKKEQVQKHHREEVKFKIPPPQQIKNKPYSLKADIATGWSSKIQLPNPIPIIFDNYHFDHLIKKLIKNPKQKAKLCYLGPRYQNTYYAWYDKPFTFPYHHINSPKDVKFTNRSFCGQHWEAEEVLHFDSFFQSGNLDAAIQVGERQYDCFMRIDSNTAGHLQWFNFKITNMQKLLKYKINICNFQKNKCLFARGMKPYILSQKKLLKQKIGWQQDGENVRFERKNIQAAKVYEMEMKSMYRLTFEIYTSFEDDTIQIAYCIPYTYSQLTNFLHTQSKKAEGKGYLKISKLCNSLGGLQVPLLIIHQKIQTPLENSTAQEIQVQRKCVIISGRAHPGQSNGSHMIEGFIQFICGDSKQAIYLRRHIVFKIVPMLNPDGVVIGNYRTGLSGKDFNREYKDPDRVVFPQVYHFKKLAAQNKNLFKDNLIMFLDFHGHSTKKNTFMYGPQFSIIDRFYYECRIFPKLLGNITSMFRYYSCMFKINEVKTTTARAVLQRKLMIPLSYTIQTSNGSFFDYETLKDVPYNEKLWIQMGKKIGQALFEYSQLIISAEKNRIQKRLTKRKNKDLSRKDKCKMNKQPISIFSDIDNQKIRMLFDEIKNADENKDFEKNSDDELSEGSSDGEDEQNDLSPAKASYLFQLIKGASFKTLSKCRLKSRIDVEKVYSKESSVNQLEIIPKMVDGQQKGKCRQSQEIIKKPSINVRKPIVSKQKILNFDSNQSKIKTAKIINFSFCTPRNPRTRNSSFDKNNTFIPSKLNFLQLVAGKWSEERSRQKGQPGTLNKAVIDLSDNSFRRTYAHSLRQKNQQLDRINEIHATYFPNKKARFQHYKYRRLLLHNEYDQQNQP